MTFLRIEYLLDLSLDLTLYRIYVLCFLSDKLSNNFMS